jgi:hypothetical protein
MHQSHPEPQLPELEEIPEPVRPPVPASVLTAARLMYTAMAVNILAIAFAAAIGVSRSAIKKANPHFSPSQVNTTVTELMVIVLVAGLVSICCWPVIARASKRGRNWAPITGTVLFAVDTLRLLLGLTGGDSTIGDFRYAAVSVACEIVIWLLALAVVVLLWRGDAKTFFKASSKSRAPITSLDLG